MISLAAWLSPATAAAVVAVIVWLVRLEARAKRAEEKAEHACQGVKALEAQLEQLHRVDKGLEVLATKMTALIERVAEGNADTRERFGILEGKIDHAMNNARQAVAAAERLARGRADQ